MQRKDEVFDYINLVVGKAYSKNEALVTANVRPLNKKNNKEITGVTSFNNCIVLFVTLDKRSKENSHKYNDIFLDNGKKLHWESQNTNTITTPHMKRIFSGESVILFVRIHEKIKSSSQPFIYIGRLSYIEHYGNKPVQVLYNVLDYQEKPNKALSAIYAWEKIDTLDIDTELPLILKKEKSSFQGRVTDIKKKKTIELYAMNKAKEDYQQQGFEVLDTSSNSPYDLECHKNGIFRRVEVKGTTTEGNAVYVTSNEVVSAHSDECETDLYIVNNINIFLQEDGNYYAEGGLVNIIENWKPEEKCLEATVYRYHLNKK
ncbi:MULTISPECIES: DUF3427 domain-containing protein [Proteus]|uniref:DUF3427 domain-containing protein n=2 Tax=Proteus penneri TaxID=102862 RepID=A0A0G4QH61_9GAMM|nr:MULTISPECIES: DUF3427 domain-containing protein [Proteus]MBJ2118295.1 DUF3427 domain-containing protein [Proteus penneri]NBL77432.1 DUF3427 domain-containing protein [Proteus sp. G2672]NBM10812.1 DUF3427 domain-containing protein [Proteus sp. G2670]NBM31493.1 DUF3427 domain-containing protein [Proteus sp. G2664]NBM57428.1 DUF3427 domain-containing protein [Proteus sp. G2667]